MTERSNQQNTDDIASNTADITKNSEDIKANLAELKTGGEERWEHIHASEEDIKANTRSIRILDAIKIAGVQAKVNLLAAFAFVGLLVIAFLLQQQAAAFDDRLQSQCRELQTQAKIINADLDILRPSLPHLDVPVCNE